MSSMPKKIIKKLTLLIFSFLFFFYSISLCMSNEEDLKIESWIDDIPILASLIENQNDVVEFDSSNGKIISISFDSKNLSKQPIYSFYEEFFKNKNWEKNEDKNLWVKKTKTIKKKTVKIENIEEEILTIKIITENF